MTEEEIGKLIIQTGSVVLILCLVFSSLSYNPEKSTAYSEDNLSYTGTRANDTVNYTQLCLDFIQTAYPDKTIERVSTYIDGPNLETGATYTILFADLVPGSSSPSGGPITISINHETLFLEFGRDQIENDFDVYYAALPDYYRKCSNNSRIALVKQFGYLPLEDNEILSNYSTNCQISFDSNYLDSIELIVLEKYSLSSNQSVLHANLTLETIIELCNEPYVNMTYFSTIYPYEEVQHPDNNYAFYLLLIIFILFITVIILYKKFQGRNENEA